MNLKNLPGFVRYVNHVFYADVVDDEIIPPPIPHPYGVLLVECPKLTEQLAINIDHKIDFYNFWLLVDKGLHEIPEPTSFQRNRQQRTWALLASLYPRA